MRGLKIFILTILILNCCGIAYSYELDTSVDNIIEKKYNSNKLNEDMSKYNSSPKQTVSSTSSYSKTAPKSTPIFDNSTPKVIKNNQKVTQTTISKTVQKTGIKIPAGTTFQVRSNAAISNWTGVNNWLTFTTTAPVFKRYITIPVGTTFKGVITRSRGAQVAGNGGLLEITIKSMTLNGKTVLVDGKITKANSKLVFFNNIKGQRQYIAGVDRKINQGVNFYKKARNLSSKMSTNPVGVVLSIIPTVTGWAGSAVCTVTSPVTGLIQKGKNISLPSGTHYEIKLTKDAYL